MPPSLEDDKPVCTKIGKPFYTADSRYFYHHLRNAMNIFDQVKTLFVRVLQLGSRGADLDVDSPLLGAIPELDSMAVVNLITALEEQFDFCVDDDEITADSFETLGSLVEFVTRKLDGIA